MFVHQPWKLEYMQLKCSKLNVLHRLFFFFHTIVIYKWPKWRCFDPKLAWFIHENTERGKRRKFPFPEMFSWGHHNWKCCLGLSQHTFPGETKYYFRYMELLSLGGTLMVTQVILTSCITQAIAPLHRAHFKQTTSLWHFVYHCGRQIILNWL